MPELIIRLQKNRQTKMKVKNSINREHKTSTNAVKAM